jgi:prephenate dehydrogenase
MWRDICIANREALLKELDLYIAELNQMRSALQEGDASRLEQTFRTAREIRAGWTLK